MKEVETAIVIELARQFMSFLESTANGWRTGYYRFRAEANRYGANASCVSTSNVELVGALRNAEFYKGMNAKALSLIQSLGKKQGVLF